MHSWEKVMMPPNIGISHLTWRVILSVKSYNIVKITKIVFKLTTASQYRPSTLPALPQPMPFRCPFSFLGDQKTGETPTLWRPLCTRNASVNWMTKFYHCGRRTILTLDINRSMKLYCGKLLKCILFLALSFSLGLAHKVSWNFKKGMNLHKNTL